MAKPPVKSAHEEEQKAVAVRPTSALPDFLQEVAQEDAGKGTSQLAADNLVPLIYLLQTNSPQVNKRNPAYVEGAEAGHIWLRNSAIGTVDGEEGILFQPCYFTADWVEWLPARGGYAGRHDGGPDEPPAHLNAIEKEIEEDGNIKKRWVLPNGNIVVYTRYHIGYVVMEDTVLPYVIPLSSTGHTVSRGWMTMMNTKKITGGKPAPSWACLYRIKTKFTSNAQGEWFKFEVTDAGWVNSLADYERGRALNESFVSGEKKIDEPEEVGEGNQHSETSAM